MNPAAMKRLEIQELINELWQRICEKIRALMATVFSAFWRKFRGSVERYTLIDDFDRLSKPCEEFHRQGRLGRRSDLKSCTSRKGRYLSIIGIRLATSSPCASYNYYPLLKSQEVSQLPL